MDYHKALLDPASVFRKPIDVLAVTEFSQQQKIKILQQWEYDIREQNVATYEGMPGASDSLLVDVHNVLHLCDADIDLDHRPPTRQG